MVTAIARELLEGSEGLEPVDLLPEDLRADAARRLAADVRDRLEISPAARRAALQSWFAAQRDALARVVEVVRAFENRLAAQPALVLADEPTGNLDSATGSALLTMMKKLNETQGVTFIFSTHDARVVKKARRVITVEDGKVISDERKD